MNGNIDMLRNRIETKRHRMVDKMALQRVEEELTLVERCGLESVFLVLGDVFEWLEQRRSPHWICGRAGSSYLLYLLGGSGFSPLVFDLDCHVFFQLDAKAYYTEYAIEMRVPSGYVAPLSALIANHPLMAGQVVSDTPQRFQIGCITLPKLSAPCDLPTAYQVANEDCLLEDVAQFFQQSYHDQDYRQLLERLSVNQKTVTFPLCVQTFGLLWGTWRYEEKVSACLVLGMALEQVPMFVDDVGKPCAPQVVKWLENRVYLFPKAHAIGYAICQYRCQGRPKKNG